VFIPRDQLAKLLRSVADLTNDDAVRAVGDIPLPLLDYQPAVDELFDLDGGPIQGVLTAAAIAARFSFVSIHNPLGSGVICTVKAHYKIPTASIVQLQLIRPPTAPLVANGTTTQMINVDTRRAFPSPILLKGGDLAAFPSNVLVMDLTTTDLQTRYCDYVLHPGGELFFVNVTANIAMEAWFAATYRPLNRLTAPI